MPADSPGPPRRHDHPHGDDPGPSWTDGVQPSPPPGPPPPPPGGTGTPPPWPPEDGGQHDTGRQSAEQPEPAAGCGPPGHTAPASDPQSSDTAAASPAAASSTAGECQVRHRRHRRQRQRRIRRSLYLTALLRTPVRMWFDDVSDWCAALTYYAILAVFPPMLVTVSAMSITGVEVGPSLLNQLNAVVPAAAHDILEQALDDMTNRHSTAWLLVILGSAGSLWFASSYLAVFRRALHTMHGTKEIRPPWVTAPRIALAAAVLLTLLMSSMLAVLLTGELSRAAGHVLGMDSAAVTVWNVVKWPVLVCIATVLVLVLFRNGPEPSRGVRRNAPGGALAVLLWLIASGGFALYAAHIGTFSRIYGSLAGIIVFLIWLWLSNLALLAGAQFNAELEKLRGRRPGGRRR